MKFTNAEIALDYLDRLRSERGELPDWYHAGKPLEEAGEAWREYLRLSGFHRRVGSQRLYADELADTVISAYAAAIKKGIDLDDVIQKKHTTLMNQEVGEGDPFAEEAVTRVTQKIDPEDGHSMMFGAMYAENTVEGISKFQLAADYLRAVGLEPNPDAIEQLALAFTPCLMIICTREYHPNGATWKRAGRKGLVREILKNTDRIHDHDWLGNLTDLDSACDLANYAGMYIRAIDLELDNWGDWGEPARESQEEGQ